MKPISKDLRYRVINYLESNQSYSSAAKKFEISENSARRWYSRYKETGSLDPKPYPGKKPRLTEHQFTSYVDSHPRSTLAQIGKHFGMTARSAHYYMRKFNYSYKKKSPAIWKQKKISETDIKKK